MVNNFLFLGVYVLQVTLACELYSAYMYEGKVLMDTDIYSRKAKGPRSH